MNIAILIPVLGRPHRVEPLLQSLDISMRNSAHTAQAIFICSESDTEEIDAVGENGIDPLIVGWRPRGGDYAKKMNHAFKQVCATTMFQFAFLGADDLRFHPDWADAAIDEHFETGACVVGTNDMGNPRVKRGRHSTHTLVHVDYAECGTADDETKLLHEGYDHNFVDQEFVETAMWRNTWAFALGSRVEHLHPHWNKSERDAVYDKGEAQFAEDRLRYQARKHLWT